MRANTATEMKLPVTNREDLAPEILIEAGFPKAVLPAGPSNNGFEPRRPRRASCTNPARYHPAD